MTTLRIDPTSCRGDGICAVRLPERIGLDEWGYPLLSAEPIPPDLLPAARAAVAGCPVLALWLEPSAQAATTGRRSC